MIDNGISFEKFRFKIIQFFFFRKNPKKTIHKPNTVNPEVFFEFVTVVSDVDFVSEFSTIRSVVVVVLDNDAVSVMVDVVDVVDVDVIMLVIFGVILNIHVSCR